MEERERDENIEIEGNTRWVKEALPLIHKVQNGPPCFLDSFSERSLGAAGSNPSLRLGQWFMAKDYMCLAAT